MHVPQRLTRLTPALPLLALLALSPPVAAEGLVQISLAGEISTPGGARVEVEIGVWDGVRVQDVVLNLHLAERTSAHDLGTLIVSRLRAKGAQVDFPGEGSSIGPRTQIFVARATHARLRLGHGMWATITTCDAAPESLRFLPPEVAKEGAEIVLVASTYHAQARNIGRAEVRYEMDEFASAATVSEGITTASIRGGFLADRPTGERWHSSKTKDGAFITGCSIELRSPGADWRVEVELAVPRTEDR